MGGVAGVTVAMGALCLMACAQAVEQTAPGEGLNAQPARDAAVASTPLCVEGAKKPCACPGTVGYQLCTAEQLGACVCPEVDDADGGMPGFEPASEPLEHCEPGIYSGTFSCTFTGAASPFPVLVEGPVGFNLEVSERGADPGCEEFCQDLVISSGSSKLFGVAVGVIVFEAALEGGLDCATGEFRASVNDGQFGFPVPVDPNDVFGEVTVAQPPIGHISGLLGGVHSGTSVQGIAGDWALDTLDFEGSCPGPFTVQLDKVSP